MKAHERLLKYVSYRTPSDENSETSPSSQCQFSLAHALVDELKELGVEDAACDIVTCTGTYQLPQEKNM